MEGDPYIGRREDAANRRDESQALNDRDRYKVALERIRDGGYMLTTRNIKDIIDEALKG